MADTPQASSSAGEIDIKVKTMQPATYDLKVLPQITVAELKQRLFEVSNVPQERQRIIYKGRVLENDQQLEAVGVQQGHSLHLVERAPPAPAPAPAQNAGQPAAGPEPVAYGSLEMDGTEGDDVSGMLASIFGQLGGQGHVAGFMAGDNGNASDEDRRQRQGQEAQFIAQQLMDSLGLGSGQDPLTGGSREPRRNTLASIGAYLDNLEDSGETDNLPILLPSLSYPPAQGTELQQQTQLMEAVREIIDTNRTDYSEEAQAFIDSAVAWQVPRAGSDRPRQTADAAANTRQAPAASSQPAAIADAAVPQSGTSPSPQTAGSSSAPAVPAGSANGAAPAAELTARSVAQALIGASQPGPGTGSGSRAGLAGAAAALRPSGQRSSGQRSSRSGTEGATGGRHATDGGRRRRRSPAITPVVTMALGSLLQQMLQGDAYMDREDLLQGSADTLMRIHSYEGAQLHETLRSLREAGSHLYRLAPVMMEIARACSAAVAALQGDAGPLALSSSQYIRHDGTRPAVGHTPGSVQHSIMSMTAIPMPFPGVHMGAPVPGTASGADANGPGPTPQAPAGGGAPRTGSPAVGARSGNQPGSAAGEGNTAAGMQGLGLNLGDMLRMAGVQHHHHMHGQHPLGASMGESRQVIQIPGAPPINIRWGGNRAATPGQAGRNSGPFSLQVGDAAPVDLAPVVQNLGSILRSAVQSAAGGANPSTSRNGASTTNAAAAAPATTASATESPAASAASAAPASGASPAGGASASGASTAANASATAGQGQSRSSQARHAGRPDPSAILEPAIMQQVVQSLMMAITPFISSQAGPAAPAAPAPQAHQGSQGTHPTPSAVTAPPAGAGPAASPLPLATAHLLQHGASRGSSLQTTQEVASAPAAASAGPTDQAAAVAVPPAPVSTAIPPSEALTGCLGPSSSIARPEGSSNPVSVHTMTDPAPMALQSARQSDNLPQQRDSKGKSRAPSGQHPNQVPRAVGLGSALPLREKPDKHARKAPSAFSSDQGNEASSSRQASASRPAPSQPQQDKVKRARMGDNQSQATSSSMPGSGQQGVEEIERPAQPQSSTHDDQLSALMSSLGAGPGSSSSSGAVSRGGGAGGLGGLMQMASQLMADPEVSQAMSGMVEQLGQGARGGRRDRAARAAQAANAPGQDPMQGLGGLMQGLAPMMQQLLSGGDSQSRTTAHGAAAQPASTDALLELDDHDRAEWERILKEDKQKQAELVPKKYSEFSAAYLAGNPPASSSIFGEHTESGSAPQVADLD